MFKLSSIFESLIEYLSDLLEAVAPDELDKKYYRYFQGAYAAGKFFGQEFVENSENDLDNEILEELFEICEEAAEKYGFSLNPLDI